MAQMDIRKARALAEQLIMSGQNDGLTREDLVQQIIAKAEGAGAPGTAISAALMAAPRTVTPATPAPMQPGVQLVAPKPAVPIIPAQQAPPMAPPQALRRPRRRRSLRRRCKNCPWPLSLSVQPLRGRRLSRAIGRRWQARSNRSRKLKPRWLPCQQTKTTSSTGLVCRLVCKL